MIALSVFNHVSTVETGPHLDGISALAHAIITGKTYLYTASKADGGLAAYLLDANGTTFHDQIGAGANRGTYGINDLDVVTINGQEILVPSGSYDDRLAFHKLDSFGDFNGVTILGASPSLIGGLDHSVTLQVAGKTFMVSSQLGQAGFQAYQIRDDLSLEHKSTWGDTTNTYAGDISALTSATLDGRSYFFAASGQDAGVTCYWMGQWGNVKDRGSAGVSDGLWVSAPSALETATVDGKLYLIVGAAGSGTLSVLRVNNWGSLFIEDHVMDALDTRFAGVSALETFSIGNRTFLLAGGSDDGLSLFEMEPGGSLFHIESIPDELNTTLMNVEVISATVINGEVHVFVSGSQAGFTQFTIDMGNIANMKSGTDNDDIINGNGQNDLIAGKDGNDTLDGMGGDDRIIDGAGVDTMTGGAGADVFVFIDDGRMDTITDFEAGTDKIDLRDFPMLYSMGQFDMIQKGYGVLITIGDDRFRIEADSSQLLISDLTTDDFLF